MTLPPIAGPLSANERTTLSRPMFGALRIASSGLSAQRVRLEVVAQNLANAETTRTPEGGPYRRKVVELEPLLNAATVDAIATTGAAPGLGAGPGLNDLTLPGNGGPNAPGEALGGVRVKGISEDTSEGPLVYDPGHPDADKSGYVRLPNVNMTDEMMDLMNARRIYEANATVFQVAKAMLHRALDI